MPIITWFIGTKAGRILMALGAASIAIGTALLKTFLAGKKSERAAEDRASIKNMQNREQTHEEVSKLGDSDVDRKLGRWVSDDKR